MSAPTGWAGRGIWTPPRAPLPSWLPELAPSRCVQVASLSPFLSFPSPHPRPLSPEGSPHGSPQAHLQLRSHGCLARVGAGSWAVAAVEALGGCPRRPTGPSGPSLGPVPPQRVANSPAEGPGARAVPTLCSALAALEAHPSLSTGHFTPPSGALRAKAEKAPGGGGGLAGAGPSRGPRVPVHLLHSQPAGTSLLSTVSSSQMKWVLPGTWAQGVGWVGTFTSRLPPPKEG